MSDTTNNQSIPNMDPFLIDPLLFGRLNRANVKTPTLLTITAITIVVAVSWTSALTNLFYNSNESSLWNDILLFVLRNPDPNRHGTVGYLRDYPSMVLTVTITISIGLVYGLYKSAAVLHAEMEKSDCVRFNDNGKEALRVAVEKMNKKFARIGRLAPVALGASLVFTTAVNLLLRSNLFSFLVPGGLYDNWWASLIPFRLGGLVWVLLGAVGVYAVYAESVLGLTYVKFLRRCKGDYYFRANMSNPDGFYGWAKLRQIISNLEAGVVCTLLSAWAMSFFLQAAAGSFIAAIVICTFAGVVLYVFIEVTSNFRRQVRDDKIDQRAVLSKRISGDDDKRAVPELLQVLIAFHRLDLVSKVPSTPVRQRWLVAGALSILGPLSAIVVQIIKYFAPS